MLVSDFDGHLERVQTLHVSGMSARCSIVYLQLVYSCIGRHGLMSSLLLKGMVVCAKTRTNQLHDTVVRLVM